MNIPFVDLHAQYLGIKSEIDEAIASVIRESAFIRSKFVTDFEQQFATAVGVKHCVSCANGTDAIYILMAVLLCMSKFQQTQLVQHLRSH
jgi:dTDP-4-amino-4,6-dideoxygalactose transaminase